MKLEIRRKQLGMPGGEFLGAPHLVLLRDKRALWMPLGSAVEIARGLKNAIQNEDINDFGFFTVRHEINIRRSDKYPEKILLRIARNNTPETRGRWEYLTADEAVRLIHMLLACAKTDSFKDAVREEARHRSFRATDPDREAMIRKEEQAAKAEWNASNRRLGHGSVRTLR